MCDYSLHAMTSRPTRAGDTLMTTAFEGTNSRGFCAKGEPSTAVCLRPGTEIAFQHEPKRDGLFWPWLLRFGFGRIGSNLVRFRKLNPDQAYVHHDAPEFANGKLVCVTSLREGRQAIVLQPPTGEAESQIRALPACMADA